MTRCKLNYIWKHEIRRIDDHSLNTEDNFASVVKHNSSNDTLKHDISEKTLVYKLRTIIENEYENTNQASK